MNDDRGPWYLLTGLLLGAALGVAYTWFFSPIKYVDASPAALGEDFKDQYRVLISSAFVANRDLPRAQARLNLLEDLDSARVLAIQAQRALAEGHPEQEVYALGLLAVSLTEEISPTINFPGENPSSTVTATVPASPSSSTSDLPPDSSPTATIEPTTLNLIFESVTTTPSPALPASDLTGATPFPSRIASPTPGYLFVLRDKKMVCDSRLTEPLIQVLVSDSAGQPVPGVEAIVSWQDGEDRLITGLKPELGLGYGDFEMAPGISYTVYLLEGGELVKGIITNECGARGQDRFWGSWSVEFVQP